MLEPFVGRPRQERLVGVIADRLRSVTVVMDAPHDPHNAAAVMRSCDAFGVQTIHVVLRSEPFLASRRVSSGADRWVDVVVHSSPEAAVSALKKAGFRLVGSHPDGTLGPSDLVGIPHLALVLGNEHDGLREELTLALDDTVRIPMRGFVESLNVSVCGAVLLHAATSGRCGDVSAAERRILYARGLYRTVNRADEILGATPPR